MSAVTELAELEASIGEAELTDDEAERVKALADEGTAVPEAVAQVIADRETEQLEPDEPTPTPAPLGEPTAKQLKSLDAEQGRHEQRVRQIMGAYVDGFEACRECSGVGLVPPGPTPQTHELFIPCETCAGFGEVLTGSLRQSYEQRDCPACLGRGYLERLEPDGSPVAPPSGTQATPPPAASQLPPPDQFEQPAPPPARPSYGVPAWMGDPQLGG